MNKSPDSRSDERLTSNGTKTYGTYEKIHQYEKSGKHDVSNKIRDKKSVRVHKEVNVEVGADIQCNLEDVFAHSDDALSLLQKLGGVSGVAERLHTNLMTGATSESISARREAFGSNSLPEEAPLTFWKIYKATWNDSMIRLLAAAAVVSLILGLTVPEPGEKQVNYKTGWVEGFAILCSVFIVTTVSAVNDYRKEQKFHALTVANAAQPIRVLRDGELVVIDVTEIVVGDVVSLSPGLVVPVDGFYARGMSVVIDESSVTGENDPKKKNDQAPILLSGTVVNTAEDAYMLACAVGENSFGGKLLMESRQGSTPRPTPLQERLDDLAELIGRVGVIAALSLFIVLSLIETFNIIQGRSNTSYRHFLDYFLLCVTIVVVAVPEGLPLAVTIALAYSQNKMHDDNNQVRRLRACETMGNATQICSDKTGTLTQNMMSVVQGYVGMNYFSIRHPGDVPEPIKLNHDVTESTRKLLTEGIAVNSSSEKVVMSADKDGHNVEPFWQWAPDKGNKTDNALLDFVDRLLINDTQNNTNNTNHNKGNVLTCPHQILRARCRQRGFAIFPFTSDRKLMSAVVVQDDGTVIHYMKGGSDRVLVLCDRYINAAGDEAAMTDEIREKIVHQVSKLAHSANRTIGIAYNRLSTSTLPEDEPNSPLVWLGLIGIQDPLRPEVAESVRKCQRAGVMVRMCTGDNLDTAVAISRQCGVFNPYHGDVAMTGRDFRNLVYDAYGHEDRMAKFWPVLDRMTVMARSQPLDKQLLVLMLMTRGEVVAVTGDGTNDAPALRLADVGFVMRSGTDIAVKSADIVLLDDNFRSVERAVVWGRCVNDNIRKFLQLQLTVNYASVALTCIGSIAARGASSPLTTVQLLWVNLIMDTLAALALATEEPSEDCLKRGPVNRRAPLISRRMNLTIIVAAFYMLAVTLVLQGFAEVWFVDARKNFTVRQTVIFNVFVLAVLAHMFNCRKLYDEFDCFEGLWSRSKWFIAVLLFCITFQIVAVQTFGEFMNVSALSLSDWFGCLVLALIILPIGLISRLIPVHEPTYGKEFDINRLDDEAHELLVKLELMVEKAQQDEKFSTGAYLESARRLQARALWCKARSHHIKGNRIVNNLRGSRMEACLSSERSML